MAEVSQNIKYVRLDDGVSFSLVRTNPKLTTNTKLMYNGKKMYMESYASSELLNRSTYKNVSVKPNSTYNKDIASFLKGSGSQAYNVYQNFSDTTISDSYDNQFETLYWCGAEYIDSSFYSEEIGFVAPLYLREKMPNYFLIFRLDTPSNYNFTDPDGDGNPEDSNFDFKTDILDKAVLIKTFDLREGSVLGKYIHNYIDQEAFEFDKSMYVNFSNCEVTYYGINKVDGVLEKKVENFENELLKNDNPLLMDDKWFTEGFERNNLIFPYIMNIEYLFDDDNFKNENGESYDFARYIGVYCNNIEFGELKDSKDFLKDLEETGYTESNVIYYFEDNKKNLHRYSNDDNGLKIDGKDGGLFDISLVSGFEKERVTGYAEPLDIYEGFINRAQYGFEILKPLEPGDWIGIEYDGHFECYFADDKNGNGYFGEKHDMLIGEYSDFRFSVSEHSTVNDIAEALYKTVNQNKMSMFEARYSDNVIAFYAKREGKQYNEAKMLMEASLIYNRKISLPISNNLKYVIVDTEDMSNPLKDNLPIEYISKNDVVDLSVEVNEFGTIIDYEKSSFGNYYRDYFCGACDVEIDPKTDLYKNIFKIYTEEYIFFDVNRYLKTNNGDGRRICANMVYINAEGKIDSDYRLVIVDDAPKGKEGDVGYDVSVSSTYQVEILDKFKPNHGILSWFPVKDFDFDINYTSYGQYGAFVDECNTLSKKVISNIQQDIGDSDGDSDVSILEYNEDIDINKIKEIAKSPFFDGFGNSLDTEYDYYLEQIHPDLCLVSKSVPYISKWGYYDEQKDSCENPYRLNVNKVFGVSNLSANTYLRNCDEDEYTHNMPYYIILNTPDYQKNYQYIASDEIYSVHYNKVNFHTFFDCVHYWIDDVFKRTDVDMFSYFFSGKKYGKRFDRKYSRLLGGDKFHNPSTLFRGVKFEAVRQYNGVEKRSDEYNNYRFSFVYIPVMLDSMIFSNTIYFVKNDTFKFIVGIIFVNTMLGKYEHNIFNGNVDYFNKGFLYAACKDLIRPINAKKYNYILEISYINKNDVNIEGVYNSVWEDNYNINVNPNIFYMWIDSDSDYKSVIVTKNTRYAHSLDPDKDIIGEFDVDNSSIGEGIKNIKKPVLKYEFFEPPTDEDYFKISSSRYHEDYDTTVYRYRNFEYYGSIECKIEAPHLEYINIPLVDVCDIDWTPIGDFGGYRVDVSDLHFTSQSLQRILMNMGEDSVISIKFYNVDGAENDGISINGGRAVLFVNGINAKISVDVDSGDITIKDTNTIIVADGYEYIENLMMDLIIKDQYNENLESLALKDYFTDFEQLSIYSITESINSDYNVKYYSTVEDNKYKIRVIEPDSIEIVDKNEAVPVKITQNNKSVVGSFDIKTKQDIDKIGINIINRYSGFYNPIFNDILYYDDYVYSESVGRLRNAVKFELPYSNTNIDYKYNDGYGEFGVIKNMYYHKTNTSWSDNILTSENPVYPAINEYALDYRDYNIFSSSWDEGYFISQDDLNSSSFCEGIGSMKDGLCMFGSKYLNIPDYIFIDTFENGKLWDEKMVMNINDNTDTEIMYKEINNRSVRYHLFIEKRLKRYLKENLMSVFEKYINKKYSFGNKGTIEDDIDEYVEKNLLKLYKVDKVYMYIKSDRMRINDKKIENDYLRYVDISNELKIKNGFPVIEIEDGVMMKDSKFIMGKINEFDRSIVYNLKPGFKEGFGFGVSFKRK